MSPEDFSSKTRAKASTDRAFGFVFASVFAIVGLLPLVSGAPVRIWALAVAAAFLAAALAVPRVLAPLNRVWTRFGALLHAVVSPLMLGIMFFGVVLPTGLLMRLLGKDPLRLRWDRRAPSYWVERTPPGPPPDSFKDQF